ncbi:hypothetical protein DYBT9275_03448 [Dyadobacter sp. CECT 9275]|uniref:Uncharacterized protein n=1 Tax=Dyadobacter helix TaxID=2822344 RepID=A0A916JEX3_9BACT|nr:hypothetical protein [Dyadobacter sp. CECT 9275]CAG5004788.1 hypothetical protein DYBT9275_03448 [Dyadobacter sp. CECT 9275]
MISTKKESSPHNRLNDVQISLLRLFDQNISEQETLEVRKLLMDYFDRALQEELKEVSKQKKYSEQDYYKMLSDDKFVIE